MKKYFALIILCVCLFAFAACGNVQQVAGIDQEQAIVDNGLELLSFTSIEKAHEPVLYDLLAEEVSTEAFRVDPIDSNERTFYVTVKNARRDSFVDIVVYLSWLDTSVVFNEGHGTYQCASTTTLVEGVWVTEIVFDLDIAFDENYIAYLDIQQITFLNTENAVENVSLNNKDIRAMHLGLVHTTDFELTVDNIVYSMQVSQDTMQAFVKEYLGTDTVLDIPAQISFTDYRGLHICPVVGILDTLYETGLDVSRINLPNTISIIAINAFKTCTALEGIYIDKTVEDAQVFFASLPMQLDLAVPCTKIYCTDGIFPIGEHVVSKTVTPSFCDLEAMTITTPEYFCSNCGDSLFGGETLNLTELTDASEVVRHSAFCANEWIKTTRVCISNSNNIQLADVIDLSKLAVIVIDFELTDFSTFDFCTSGQLELCSNGRCDDGETTFDLFKNGQLAYSKTSDTAGKFVFSIFDATHYEINPNEACDLSKINYMRMYFLGSQDTTTISTSFDFTITNVTFLGME